MSFYLCNSSIHQRDFDGWPYLLRQYICKDWDNPTSTMTCASSLFDVFLANKQWPTFNARREYWPAVPPLICRLLYAKKANLLTLAQSIQKEIP